MNKLMGISRINKRVLISFVIAAILIITLIVPREARRYQLSKLFEPSYELFRKTDSLNFNLLDSLGLYGHPEHAMSTFVYAESILRRGDSSDAAYWFLMASEDDKDFEHVANYKRMLSMGLGILEIWEIENFDFDELEDEAVDGDWYVKYLVAKLILDYCDLSGQMDQSYRAIEFLKSAAISGYPPAMLELGLCYGNGIGVELDFQSASNWLHRGALKGNPECQYVLGEKYFAGEWEFKQSIDSAIEFTYSAALANNVRAQLNLAKWSLYGEGGVAKDEEIGMYWANMAVENGNSDAENLISDYQRQKEKIRMAALQSNSSPSDVRQMLLDMINGISNSSNATRSNSNAGQSQWRMLESPQLAPVQSSRVCQTCNNQKVITCNYCGGQSERMCPKCSGSGYQYYAGNTIRCGYCSAKGVTYCGHCRNGVIQCPTCRWN